MKYPILTRSRCQDLAAQFVQGAKPVVGPHVTWMGSDDEINLDSLQEVARDIMLQIARSDITDRDRFEGTVSVDLYMALELLPGEILDDPGFWAYISLDLFWDFIAWREEGPFSRGNYLKYVDGQSSTESVLNRMFLRAASIGGETFRDLPGAIPKGTDFWRSHVLRVRTGTVPTMTRALVRTQRDERLPTSSLRDLARRLNRTWANVTLYGYDDVEADSLIEELRDQIPEPAAEDDQ